jgi:glycosyltransferase involved in cell wall biosynthesis
VKWVEKILVVDSFSNDGTLEICREYTDWIVQHEYLNSAAQKNWAMNQIETDWTLQLDSDEEIEPELQDEIRRALTRDAQPDGYRIRIKNLMWGKWMRSCDYYPCVQIRLFRSSKGRWTSREVHAKLQGLSNVENLEHHILHHDMRDLSEELQQFSRQVVVWESNELVKKNRRWHWWDVCLRPAAIFVVYYVQKGGFREGFRGYYTSVYKAFYSFMTYSRLYESEIRRGLRG